VATCSPKAQWLRPRTNKEEGHHDRQLTTTTTAAAAATTEGHNICKQPATMNEPINNATWSYCPISFDGSVITNKAYYGKSMIRNGRVCDEFTRRVQGAISEHSFSKLSGQHMVTSIKQPEELGWCLMLDVQRTGKDELEHRDVFHLLPLRKLLPVETKTFSSSRSNYEYYDFTFVFTIEAPDLLRFIGKGVPCSWIPGH